MARIGSIGVHNANLTDHMTKIYSWTEFHLINWSLVWIWKLCKLLDQTLREIYFHILITSMTRNIENYSNWTKYLKSLSTAKCFMDLSLRWLFSLKKSLFRKDMVPRGLKFVLPIFQNNNNNVKKFFLRKQYNPY